MTAYLDNKDLANTEISPERVAQITEGVKTTLDKIRAAEDAAGRTPGSVKLLAATKTRDVGEIMAALKAGVTLIGENRPQEMQIKAETLIEECNKIGMILPGVHLIGQLQSNKINKILPWVNTIESVESAEQAYKISTRAQAVGKRVRVYLEVNVSGEESKSGCSPVTAFDEALAISMISGVRLSGLMTVGAHAEGPDSEKVIRRGFERLKDLRNRLLSSGVQCHQLSMGMSDDMSLAIAEGATIVRVGTGIFGPRAFV